LKSVIDYLVDAIRSPREQLSRGQHFVRQSFELTVYCWRQLARNRAEGMAAELTYRTIFALIPVVVLGLVMFRIVGGLDEVQEDVENQLYSFFGVPDVPDDYASPALEAAAVIAESDDGEPPSEANAAAGAASGDATKPAVDEAGDTDAIDAELTDAEGPDPEGPDAVVERPSPATAEESETRDVAPAADGEAVVDVEEALVESEGNNIDREVEAAEQSRAEARASIRRTLQTVTAKVSSLDFKSIGVFGLLLFIYAAIAWQTPSSISSIESMRHPRSDRSIFALPSIGPSLRWAADSWLSAFTCRARSSTGLSPSVRAALPATCWATRFRSPPAGSCCFYFMP